MKDHSHSTIVRRNIATCAAAISLTIVAGSILTSNRTIAEGTTSANAAVTVPFACTMSGTGNNSHNATITPNTYSGASGSEYQNGIGKTTLTAICNDDNGFSIYAIGYTGNSYDSENHTKLVGSTTGGTIATKAYASGDTTSNWSMKLTKVTDTTQSYNPQNLTLTTGYDAWHAVPDTYTKVAEYHANTGSSATDTTLGVKLETTYAAFIAANQPADTYTGQVKYTMVHPYDAAPAQPQSCNPGKICYFANVSDAVGTMGQPTIAPSATSATLLASNFSRAGYGFAGWSDKFDYATNPEAKFYGPQETITFTAGQYIGSNPGLSLYAVWIKSEGSIQDQSKVASICNSLTTAPTDGTANLSSVSALTDQRDNETYAIAKLADGNCWMIENMRLDHQYTIGTTNATLSQGYNASFTGLADSEESTRFTNATTANSLYSIDGSTTNTISGSNLQYRFPRYNGVNTPADANDRPNNPTSNSFNDYTQPVGMYSYGNYYTWHAAIADTTNYATNNTGAITSICPSGWHLPKGGDKANETNNDFWSLIVTNLNNNTKPTNYSTSTGPYYSASSEAEPVANILRSYPNNFLYSGKVSISTGVSRGSDGLYWSSIVSGNNTAYNLLLSNSEVRPGATGWQKYYGMTIRCMVSGI